MSDSTNGPRAGNGHRSGAGSAGGDGGVYGQPATVREPCELLPLTEPAFHILLALSERARHGYAILLDVREVTSGQVRLSTGTLYTAVRRLVEEGLIEEMESAGGSEADRRRVYRITSFGRTVASAESRRIANLAALARSRGLLAHGARLRA